MQTGRASIELDILLRLNIEDDHLLETLALFELLGVWATPSEDDQVPLEACSCVAEAPLEIMQFIVFFQNAPNEVNRIDRSNIIEDISGCASVSDELLADREDVHVDTAAWFLTGRVRLLFNVDALQVVFAFQDLDWFVNLRLRPCKLKLGRC